MRLWHYKLIPYLDRQRLLGQHRECCALRGRGWGKKHSTVDYVFEHDPIDLICYHWLVMNEMIDRGYNVDPHWAMIGYSGKALGFPDLLDYQKDQTKFKSFKNCWLTGYCKNPYPENHTDAYLIECISLLEQKHAPINIDKIKKELIKNA